MEMHFFDIHRVMVPNDSFDTELLPENVPYLRDHYPRTPEWLTQYRFPPAVPIPLPPLLYYYHRQIRTATGERLAFFNRLFELEYALQFAVGWWYEAAGGHRGWVLPQETIDWLRTRLGNIEIALPRYGFHHRVRFEYVAQRMQEVRNVDERERNFAVFAVNDTPNAYLVWTERGTGRVDTAVRGRRTLHGEVNGRWYIENVETGRLARVNFRFKNLEDYTERGAGPSGAARDRAHRLRTQHMNDNNNLNNYNDNNRMRTHNYKNYNDYMDSRNYNNYNNNNNYDMRPQNYYDNYYEPRRDFPRRQSPRRQSPRRNSPPPDYRCVRSPQRHNNNYYDYNGYNYNYNYNRNNNNFHSDVPPARGRRVDFDPPSPISTDDGGAVRRQRDLPRQERRTQITEQGGTETNRPRNAYAVHSWKDPKTSFSKSKT